MKVKYRTGARGSSYLVLPYDDAAPKFRVRAHSATEAGEKAKARLLEMEEHFVCGFDLITEKRPR